LNQFGILKFNFLLLAVLPRAGPPELLGAPLTNKEGVLAKMRSGKPLGQRQLAPEESELGGGSSPLCLSQSPLLAFGTAFGCFVPLGFLFPAASGSSGLGAALQSTCTRSFRRLHHAFH
jgi:hypothetical protein